MKMTLTVGIASALLLAGCAHEERSVQTDENGSPNYSSYSAQSRYDTQNYSSLPSPGSAYTGTAGATGASAIPQGKPSRSDNAIVAQVRETLQQDAEIAFVVPNIQISANNGAIILTGSVQSEEQKRQIMAKVLAVNGVLAVNNQLSVMSGPNGKQDSQLNPTSDSGSERLYKDSANGPDTSTNNVLNPTSRDNESSQLYRESNPGANNSGELNPTSRENGDSKIFHGTAGESASDLNSNLHTNNSQQMP